MTNEQLCVQAKAGDSQAREQLIEKNIPFIKKTAYELWNAQPELNAALQIDLDDLVQEGSLGLYGCIESYDPESGNLFLTYAGPAVKNAMLDYIRLQSASFEGKKLNELISLDDAVKGEAESSEHISSEGSVRREPEEIYLAKERVEEIHRALGKIEARNEKYLRYRFGFDDDTEHPLAETAKHFHLTESRAKSTEKAALEDISLELHL